MHHNQYFQLSKQILLAWCPELSSNLLIYFVHILHDLSSKKKIFNLENRTKRRMILFLFQNYCKNRPDFRKIEIFLKKWTFA